jgi:hypothetical protein
LQVKLLDGIEMMGKATRTMERRDEKGNNYCDDSSISRGYVGNYYEKCKGLPPWGTPLFFLPSTLSLCTLPLSKHRRGRRHNFYDNSPIINRIVYTVYASAITL